jgi:hypothetical protein
MQDFNVTLSSLEVQCSSGVLFQIVTIGSEPTFVPFNIVNNTQTLTQLTAVFEPFWMKDGMLTVIPSHAKFDQFNVGFEVNP